MLEMGRKLRNLDEEELSVLSPNFHYFEKCCTRFCNEFIYSPTQAQTQYLTFMISFNLKEKSVLFFQKSHRLDIIACWKKLLLSMLKLWLCKIYERPNSGCCVFLVKNSSLLATPIVCLLHKQLAQNISEEEGLACSWHFRSTRHIFNRYNKNAF